MHVASSGGRCAPGVCAVDELEEFLEVGRSSDDDVLGGGDGPRRLVLGLHHTLDESQPVELSAHTKGHHKRRYTIQKKMLFHLFALRVWQNELTFASNGTFKQAVFHSISFLF